MAIAGYPEVSITWLERTGMLEGGVEDLGCQSWDVDPRPNTATVSYNPSGEFVTFTVVIDGQTFRQEVIVTNRSQGVSHKKYFICEKTGKLISTLYYNDGRFKSRHELKLRYQTQDMRRNTSGLLRKPAPARDACDTPAALMRAEGKRTAALEGWAADLNNDRLFAERNPHSLHEEWGAAVPIATLEVFPELDLRALPRTLVSWGRQTAFQLSYPRGSPIGPVYVGVDLRDPEVPLLKIKCRCEKGALLQAVLLEAMTHDRMPLTAHCPVTHVPSKILYYREGRFASREAQRLNYRSQIDRA